MRSKQHVKSALAVTLAVATVAAPAASAQAGQAGWVVQPNPDQQAAQLARAAAAPSQTSRLVQPNADEQTGAALPHDSRPRSVALSSSYKASVATPDQATIARDQVGDAQLSAALLRSAQIYGRNITPSTAVVSVKSNPQGFQFGDAAIGAGVMAGLVTLGLAGTLVVRRRAQLRHG
jgi:hypothetical protein